MVEYGSDYRLRDWPACLFAEEARSIAQCTDATARARQAEHLFQEVFAGDTPKRELAAATRASWGGWGEPAFRSRNQVFTVDQDGVPVPDRDDVSQLLLRLAGDAEQFPIAPRRYWRARKRPTPSTPTPALLDAVAVQQEWAKLVHGFDSAGYLDVVVASPCADGVSQQERDECLSSKLSDEAGFEVAWPADVAAGRWDDDEFFTLVEVVHDLVARPRSTSYHEYGQDLHYDDFHAEAGQELYRYRVNELFRRSPSGLHLVGDGPHRGMLDRRPPDGLDGLASTVLARADEPSSESDDVVGRATAAFLDRHADRVEKRHACVLLAGELERQRVLLKAELLTKDEGMLFQIANQFAIRHQRADQHDDYADDYLDWVFWTFLATVELSRSLAGRDREALAASPPQASAGDRDRVLGR